jgi:DNA invertase Pin-like site-specific DNA recombinase
MTIADQPRKPLRCAIYTRKSTEDGLEQEFNSLDAQRQSAEAYIKSQQSSGWVALPDRYDDGGYSGASLERPALQQLLAAIDAGKIDCIVVYKVDRLSRSLLDFARVMSLFDQRGVSFVSVTQEFNTTTSLGRLTLNILLSFAQFEREIIGERTRDKLSAARRKGKWIGGIPVLGYDVDPRGGRLLINPEEAQRVREVFSIAERLGTLSRTLKAVNERGLLTKSWVSRGGRVRIGKPFSKSGLSALLANVLYKGCIRHKGTVYPGEQEAMVDVALWEKVNRRLELRRTSQSGRRHHKQNVLLENLVRCGDCGTPLVAVFTRKRGQRHTYYVCPQARQRKGCRQRPVAIQDLETSLRQHLEPRLGPQPSAFMIRAALERVLYASHTRTVTVVLSNDTRFEFALPPPNRRGVRQPEPCRSGRVPRISKLMSLAIKIERLVQARQAADYAAMAQAGHISRPRMTQIMNLTNLAPEIQETLLFLPETHVGPDAITERQLRPIVKVVDWAWQKKLFSDLLAQTSA